MPPAYVKPYVKRHKNDAADAEAICEAVAGQTLRAMGAWELPWGGRIEERRRKKNRCGGYAQAREPNQAHGIRPFPVSPNLERRRTALSQVDPPAGPTDKVPGVFCFAVLLSERSLNGDIAHDN